MNMITKRKTLRPLGSRFYTMFVIYFALVLVVHGVLGLPTELKDCEYCHNNSAQCTAGHELRNNCVRCRCSEEHLYQCKAVSPPCDEDEENVVLGKPTQARCVPSMVYVRGPVICMCSKGGYWPHEKCEITFKTLTYRKNQQASQSDESSSSEEKCIPNSYVVQDCNVCRCNADGVMDRCTQNDCTKKVVIRRTYNNVHGSCIPNNWYSLGPCQFCHCQQTNKLVCSTRFKETRSLRLGAYNLTDCGKDLIKELYELAPPEGPTNLLRDGAVALFDHPTATTTKTPLTKRKLPHPRTAIVTKNRPYDANLELSFNLNNPVETGPADGPYSQADGPYSQADGPYSQVDGPYAQADGPYSKIDGPYSPADGPYSPFNGPPAQDEYESEDEGPFNEANRQEEQTTLGMFENDEVSVEEKKPSSYVRLSDGSYRPVYDEQERASLRIPNPAPTQKESLQEALVAKGLPKEMVQILTSIPEVSQMQTTQVESDQKQNLQDYDVSIKSVGGQNQPHVLRINLPSVLDSIIKMALRKSMVKIDASRTCTPGTTTQEGCNFCYCLTNGKLLCTDKKTC